MIVPSSGPFGATFPIPSVAARHLPLTRGVGPQGADSGRSGVPPLRANRNISGRAGEDIRPYDVSEGVFELA